MFEKNILRYRHRHCNPQPISCPKTARNIRLIHFEVLEDRTLLSSSAAFDPMQLYSEAPELDFCQEVRIDANLMTAHYEWNIPELHPTIDHDTSEVVESIILHGAALTGKPNQAILPVVPVILALPSGMQSSAIDVSVGAEHIIPGEHTLVTSGTTIPTSTATPTNTAVDQQDAHDDFNVPFEILGVQRRRGVDVVLVNLKPVQYDTENGIVSYFEAMDISIQLESAMSSTTAAELIYRPDDIHPLSQWVHNPQQLDDYTYKSYPDADASEPDTKSLGICDPNDTYRYVVITNKELADAATDYTLRDLADFHDARGLSSIIVTTELIYNNYTGVDNPEQIRNFIIDAYNNWETDFILLGGDTNIIPCRELYIPPEAYIPSDLYYQCLDGSYNEDGDSQWGENTDGPSGSDVDFLAEVYVGRASAETPSEMANWVFKNLTYSYNPVSQHRLNAVMVGEYIGFGTPSDFAKPSMEEIRLGSSNHGYTTLGFASDPQFATSTLYDADGTWPASQLVEMMNSNNYGIFNHIGHSDTNYVMKLYNDDVDTLTNDDYYFIYSQGCLPGNLPSDAIAEHFTTSTRNGAFAVIFNSSLGWGLSNSTDGPSQRLNREFWDAFFNDNMTQLGPMNAASHENVLWDIGNDYIRWVIYESNLFGDPAVDIGVNINGIDLLGTSLNIYPDDLLHANGITEATIELFNAGDEKSDPFNLNFYLSEDDIIDPGNPADILLQLDPSDPNYNNGQPEIYRVNGLNAFSQWSDTILLSVPANDPFVSSSNYYIGMVVDSSDGVLEVLETNNMNRGENLDFAQVNYNATIYDRDMSFNPNWTLEGDWAWGIPAGNEGDPSSGHTGDYVIGYNLNGEYSNNLPASSATTHAIDCTGYSNVTLSFYRWLGIESSTFDHARIEVSNNGVDWITVWTHNTGSYTDISWVYQEFDISTIADDQMQVYVRWDMGPTDEGLTYCGWNIDDVLITGTPLGLDVRGPMVIGHTPEISTAVQSAMTFQFNEAMDASSFSVAEDVISFIGPSGDLMSQITGFTWIKPYLLEVQFAEQSLLGTYTMVIGSNITDDDPSYNPMNQDQDAINGEIPDDRYTASFEIARDTVGPSVMGYTPMTPAETRSSILFQFDEPMETVSFSVAEDVVRFTGPSGDLLSQITGFHWIDSYALELQFLDQSTVGIYTIEIGPGITDDGPSFNAMDQDGDAINGEIPDDRYTASFEIIDMIYSADMSTHPAWTLEGDWAWGIPAGNEGDPSSGHTGDYVVGYNLAGNYSNNLPVTYATTPAIDCSGYADVTLSFYRWLGIESSSNDHAGIEVSADGVNWTTVWNHITGSFTDTNWIYQEYDISAVADDQPTVYVRWEMGPTDDWITYCGWNLDDVLIFTKIPEKTGPMVIGHQPVSTPVGQSSMLFQFNEPMDTDSFSVAEDVYRFTGPSGDLLAQITGYHWIDSQSLELYFTEQSTVGSYTLEIGPGITDDGSSFNAMNQDGDAINGEIPDDRYMASFGIIDVIYSADMSTNPEWTLEGEWAWGIPAGWYGDPNSGYTGDHVIGYNLRGDYRNNLAATYATTPAIDCSGRSAVTLIFHRWLGIESSENDHASIEVSNDGVNWTTIWIHNNARIIDKSWIYQEYDISAVADDQSTVYVRWGLGPTNNKVTDCGWNIDDVLIFSKTSNVTGPVVIGHTPERTTDAQSAITFYFNEPMATDSFNVAEDVLGFTGPAGDLLSQITGFAWIDVHSLEVQFSSQTTPGMYAMVIGPGITDDGPDFTPMNQDRDAIHGEIPDDCYTASFEMIDVLYSAKMDINPEWTLEGDWAWGIPRGHSDDPDSGYTGDFVIGYNLNGNYSNNLQATYATTPAIDCSYHIDITLSFYRWLGIESSDNDHASIEVSNDGVNWTTIWEHSTGSFTDTSWVYQEYDISTVADNQPTVFVRWNMGPTNSKERYCGWNIDDVLIGGTLIGLDVMGPAITEYIPTRTTHSKSSILFQFDEPMDTDSFSVAEDVVRFTGPTGDILSQITGFHWIDSYALELQFLDQSTVGIYTLEIGPGITDDGPSFNAMDQDGDAINGEIPDDRYTATFEIIDMIYSADMSTHPAWTLEGDWAWGVPAGNEGDPSSGHTGDYVVGYNLAGNYSNNLPVTYATTPAIDCSGYADITLSLYRWLGMESSIFDHAGIEVSADGVNWTTVWNHITGSFTDTNWIYQEYDISAVADDQPTVFVRWGMGPTDYAITSFGWNIDDVMVSGKLVSVTGDFNSDLVCDRVDLDIWSDGFNEFPSGGATLADGDADGDGDVDGHDFLIWQRNFGRSVTTIKEAGSVGIKSSTSGAPQSPTRDASRTLPYDQAIDNVMSRLDESAVLASALRWR